MDHARSRSIARAALAALCAGGLLAGAFAHVSAHANYQRSDPAANSTLDAPPSALHVWFVEAPDPKKSALTVYDATRQPVGSGVAAPDATDNTELSVPLSLPGPGVYTVAWETVSAVDGDPAHGYFTFGVGLPAPGGAAADLGTQPAGDLQIGLTLTPAGVGANGIQVRVTDAGGATPGDVQRVTLRLQPPPPDLGLAEVVVPPAGGGGFSLPSLLLGLPGPWQVDVRVRRAGKDDVDAQFSVPIAAPITPGAAPTPSG